MRCAQFKNQACLYLSGEIDAKHAAEFDRHIRECSGCQQFMDLEKATDNCVRVACLEEAPDATAVKMRVMARIDRQIEQEMGKQIGSVRLFWKRSPIWSLGLAGCMIACVLFTVGIVATRRQSTLYAAAAHDHIDDVIKHVPKQGWRTTQADIKEYVSERLGSTQLLERFSIPGYRLTRARDCRLANQTYVHLIYSNGHDELSFFIWPQSRTLLDRFATAKVERSVDSRIVSGLDVTRGISGSRSIFLVGNLSSSAAQRIADSALRAAV